MESSRELGSEFPLSFQSLSRTEDNLFHYLRKYQTQWFDYGRSAIRYMSMAYEGTILLPEFICESVIRCFSEDRIQFYHIGKDLKIDFADLRKKMTRDVSAVYIVHYFGQLQAQEELMRIRKIADEMGVVMIEDTTQSLFSKHMLIGDYAIASVRKWMQTPQGAVLYAGNGKELPEPLTLPQSRDNDRARAMVLKDLFLSGEYDTNAQYRKMFSACERRIDLAEKNERMSDLAHFIIGCVRVSALTEQRRSNANRLKRHLDEMGLYGVCDFSETECPFVYPLRVKNRDSFREYLIRHHIYCAVHWPFDAVGQSARKNAAALSETLISLPIDQRYKSEDMDYLAEVISRFGGELSF